MSDISPNDLTRALKTIAGIQPGITQVSDIIDHLEWCQGDFYKIVECSPQGRSLSLFHSFEGYDGNKTREFSKPRYWYKAIIKQVKDAKNGPVYTSGFHIFDDLPTAVKYMRRFKKKANGRYKAIIKVKARNIWKKEHSSSKVYLSEYIYPVDLLNLYNNK